jgi:hypothetical protein
MRTFTSQSLISLPSLSARQALALATQLETHAKGRALSADAADALADLTSARRALEKEYVASMAVPTTSNPQAVAADRVLDRAWGATSALVGAWVQIDEKNASPLARELDDALFSEGTAFLKARYEEEWAESSARLRIIEERGLAGHFEKLGAGVFLAAIKRAHAEYGKALGVTAAKAPSAASPKVREALDQTAVAMREYVAKVAAMVSRKRKGSAELADALLLPLTQWQSSRSAPVDAPVPPPPPPADPTEPTEPGTGA